MQELKRQIEALEESRRDAMSCIDSLLAAGDVHNDGRWLLARIDLSIARSLDEIDNAMREVARLVEMELAEHEWQETVREACEGLGGAGG